MQACQFVSLGSYFIEGVVVILKLKARFLLKRKRSAKLDRAYHFETQTQTTRITMPANLGRFATTGEGGVGWFNKDYSLILRRSAISLPKLATILLNCSKLCKSGKLHRNVCPGMVTQSFSGLVTMIGMFKVHEGVRIFFRKRQIYRWHQFLAESRLFMGRFLKISRNFAYLRKREIHPSFNILFRVDSAVIKGNRKWHLEACFGFLPKMYMVTWV